METWINSELKFVGRVVRLRVGQVRLDDGRVANREVVEHPGGVAVVPVYGDSVILVRQFRIAIGRELLELPAGRIEPGERPEVAVLRELEEEVGFRAEKLIPVCEFYSCVGFSNEKTCIFLAFNLKKTHTDTEWDERIETIILPLEEIEDRLANKEFEDSKTIIGLRELLAYIAANPGMVIVGEHRG
jgi:ADP-ribose pyrophosphatase